MAAVDPAQGRPAARDADALSADDRLAAAGRAGAALGRAGRLSRSSTRSRWHATTRDERHLELIARLDSAAPPSRCRWSPAARTIGALTLPGRSRAAATARPRSCSRRSSPAARRSPSTTRSCSRGARGTRARRKRRSRRLRDLEVISEAALTHLDLDRPAAGPARRRPHGACAPTPRSSLLLDEKRRRARRVAGPRASRRTSRRASACGFRSAAASRARGRHERRPVFIPDVEQAPSCVNPLLPQRGLKSLLGVPLLVEGRLLGVLHVGSIDAARLRRTTTSGRCSCSPTGSRSRSSSRASTRTSARPAGGSSSSPRRASCSARRSTTRPRCERLSDARRAVPRRLVHRRHRRPRRAARARGRRARRPGARWPPPTSSVKRFPLDASTRATVPGYVIAHRRGPS